MSLETPDNPEQTPEVSKVERHPNVGRKVPRRASTDPLPVKKSVFRELGEELPRVEELDKESKEDKK